MTKSEAAVIAEITELMNRCPAPSPNPYDLNGIVRACNDYKKIHRLAIDILNNYSFYARYKNMIGSDQCDDDYPIIMAKENYETKMQELKDYIAKRSSEDWS
jgi:hypothetical protein